MLYILPSLAQIAQLQSWQASNLHRPAYLHMGSLMTHTLCCPSVSSCDTSCACEAPWLTQGLVQAYIAAHLLSIPAG